MRITFAYDKKAKKPHYQVRHSDINEGEFEEVFSQPVVVIGQKESGSDWSERIGPEGRRSNL